LQRRDSLVAPQRGASHEPVVKQSETTGQRTPHDLLAPLQGAEEKTYGGCLPHVCDVGL